jgi:hypothetical protein
MVNAMKQPDAVDRPDVYVRISPVSPEHFVPMFTGTGDVNVFVPARFNHLPSAPHAYRSLLKYWRQFREVTSES